MSTHKSETGFQNLVDLMARLRAPDGCPWDRAQDAHSLKKYLVEETYEVLDAIEEGDPEALQDELGDLLLQVLFQAQIAKEADHFGIEDVVAGLHDKLVRRHPHVFGDARADSPDEVKANWDELKESERTSRGKPNGTLSKVPRHLPALPRAHQLTSEAATVGFDWRKLEDVVAKLEEEAAELRRAVGTGDRSKVEEEAGDLLFAAVNVARFAGADPEAALHRANRKFVKRFEKIEAALALRGKSPRDATLEEMDAIWNEIKDDR